MTRRRGRNLAPSDIDVIVALLDGWSGPVSWNRVIDAVELRLFCRYTRQALSAHEKVSAAFAACRIRPAKVAGPRGGKQSSESKALHGRLARRAADVDRLEAENKRLLEQFVVWLYNAQTRGLSLEDLERPLPLVRRGQTKT